MHTNKIRLFSHERRSSAVCVPDRYEFNAKGKMPWLQKVLFKILHKLKAYSFDTAQVSNETRVYEMKHFNFSAPIGMNREITVLGLEVIVVPWIEGFFVLPELDKAVQSRAA